MSDDSHFVLDESAADLEKLGSALHDLLFDSPDRHKALVELATRAIGLTAALDQVHRQATGATPYTQLTAQIMVFQYDLYATSPHPGQAGLMHIALHALQIYSDVVLWPMPATYGVRERLSRVLMRALKDADTRHTDLTEVKQYWKLVLWAAVMWAMASEGQKLYQGWYLQRIATILQDNGIGWIEFMDIMMSFCWRYFTFAEHVKDIWSDACAARTDKASI
jgi:hypothetical protein